MGDGMKLFTTVLITIFFYSCVFAKMKPGLAPLPSAQVVLVIVVDQLAEYHLQDLIFKHGFKLFINQGFSYENAHFNTAVPGTACDHTTLSSGTYASTHGIIANTWFNQDNKLIPAEQDNRFPLLDNPGQKITGASAFNIMTDTLSDQVMFSQSATTPYQAVAVSVKARAAICCGGRNGAVFWFNENTGNMTSSTAYFKELPAWVTEFNKEHNPLVHLESITWRPFYQDPNMYNRYIIAQNDFQPAPTIFNTTITLKKDGKIIDEHLELFERTPAMDDILFPFAKLCFDQYKPTGKNDHLLFWLSVSTLDKIGHVHGPWSKEAIDYLYHLDAKLLDFMEYVQKSVGKENVLFVLTADHGTIQIPEQINRSPVPLGHRIYTKTLIEQMNHLIEQKYGISDAIIGYQAPGFYINKQIDAQVKKAIAQDVKNMLRALPQIKHVWTADELSKTCDKDAQPFKNQFYEGRSPDIICEPTPYTLISKDPVGIDHASPYNYDTQVPLVFYWPGHLPPHRIYDPINMTQLARTLSFILDVPPPSASVYQVLPELLPCLTKKQKR